MTNWGWVGVLLADLVLLCTAYGFVRQFWILPTQSREKIVEDRNTSLEIWKARAEGDVKAQKDRLNRHELRDDRIAEALKDLRDDGNKNWASVCDRLSRVETKLGMERGHHG